MKDRRACQEADNNIPVVAFLSRLPWKQLPVSEEAILLRQLVPASKYNDKT